MPLPPSQWTIANRDQWDGSELISCLLYQCATSLERWPSSESMERHKVSYADIRHACPVEECNAVQADPKDSQQHPEKEVCAKKPNDDAYLRGSDCYLCRTGSTKLSDYLRHLNGIECERRTERLLDAIRNETPVVSVEFCQSHP